MNVGEYLSEVREKVDGAIVETLSRYRGEIPEILLEAMEYSLTAGGKRFRPALLMTGFSLAGGEAEKAIPYAVAVEFIHTYSLIHDDLPAMDDDDFRRGLPTCHVRFGEAIAILAGDALLTEAFALFLEERDDGIPPERKVRAAREVAVSAGAKGMVGGQVLDMQFMGREVTVDDVEKIHLGKTASLIRGAITAGVILGGGSEDLVEKARSYGTKLGLSFQIVDDILDRRSSLEEMGKRAGKDDEAGKPTYVRAAGIEKAEETARRLAREARELFPGDSPVESLLRGIADFCVERTK